MNYSAEKNVQILVSLLKAHGIRKIIASPGTTNVSFVASVQYDNYFEVFSAADERSAAYIACGLAEESGEPVVITCTGATASRNYISGLTEAYYRKIPVLAITATQPIGRVGQNIAQVIDRSAIQKDIAKLSIHIPVCRSKEDEWACNLHINRALLELTRNGNGPVHLNLETTYNNDFSVKVLPKAFPIYRIEYGDDMPEIPQGNIGIFVGAHSKWSVQLTQAVDNFCEQYNAVVLCDQTSNYRGKHRVLFSIVTSQEKYHATCNNFDLLIHIGNVSGSYPRFRSKAEWRVNLDGEVRDTFKHLRYVFQMREEDFFCHYLSEETEQGDEPFYSEWQNEFNEISAKIPELPFSNIWLAHNMAPLFPSGASVHIGILNTLRSMNFFETPPDVMLYSNTGGFGIDGDMSAAIGASLFDSKKLIYCIIGDLAFFYDMNSLGNRHVSKNIRILLINNGRGTEFRNYSHRCAAFGNDADYYMAAAGHYGNQSDSLVRHYAEDLGFEYIAIHNKEESTAAIDYFMDNELHEKPLLIEAFVNWKDESDALFAMTHLVEDNSISEKNKTLKSEVREVMKKAIGKKGVTIIKAIKNAKDLEG